MKNKLFCYFLIYLLFMGQVVYAQQESLVISPEMQYQYAQDLFDEKDYETALVEFKRFIHFFPESKQQKTATFNTGVCLYQLKKYDEATRVFNDIILKGQEDRFTQESYFLQSKAFMNMGNIAYAQIVLQNYLKLADDMEIRDRIYFNLAQIHLAKAKNFDPGALAPAKASLLKISDPGKKKYNTDPYVDLIVKAQNAPKKNPTVAGILAIIPGIGFLYCERFSDALMTFCLNAGLMVAAYEAYDHDFKALAGVIGFVETGFYTGNIYGSITSAHKYNQAQTLRILNTDFSMTTKINPENLGYEMLFSFNF